MRESFGKPAIIDVEASGFGAHSYPIEIGAVLFDGTRFSRLIRPFPDWTHWCEQAESTHGISRELLAKHGSDAHEVAIELNHFLAGCTVYTDCWTVDKPWLDTLFYRCALAMNFYVSPLEAILSDAQMASWADTAKLVRSALNVRRHRASMDALVIQETYLQTRNATG